MLWLNTQFLAKPEDMVVTLAPVSKTNVPETSFSVTSTSIPLDEDCFNLIGSSKEIERDLTQLILQAQPSPELDFGF